MGIKSIINLFCVRISYLFRINKVVDYFPREEIELFRLFHGSLQSLNVE